MDCSYCTTSPLHLYCGGPTYSFIDSFNVLRKMPTDIFPEIDIPVVAMLWDYKGINSKEIADRLTGSVERSMWLIDGIEHSESGLRVGLPPPIWLMQWPCKI